MNNNFISRLLAATPVLLVLFSATTAQAQHVQWAARLVAVSSQKSEGKEPFAPAQVLSTPNALPLGQISNDAWIPRKEGPNEFIEVRFARSIAAQQVTVVENFNPGSITKIELVDTKNVHHEVYSNPNPGPLPEAFRTLEVRFPAAEYRTLGVKVYMNTAKVEGVNQIDAIGIADVASTMVKQAFNAPKGPDVVKSTQFDSSLVNLGPNVNSRYVETHPVISPNGRTLYFARQGHPENVGGSRDPQDVWYSTLVSGKNKTWGLAKNLGTPINTPDDDVFFVTSASGRHGYYSSDRPGGLGAKDIYRITFLGPEKQPLLSEEDQLLASRLAPVKQAVLAPAVAVATAQVTILKGTVTDEATKQPLDAAIDLIDNSSGQTIANFRSNATSGRYLVSLPSGTNYGIVVRQDGYLFHSENFDLPASAAFAEVVKDIPLKRLEVGKIIVLRNIFFDTGKATLRPESTAELERLQILVDGAEDKYMLQIFLREAKALHDDMRAGPFFYEVIQRCGDEGFGYGNFRALFESIERFQKTGSGAGA